MNHSDLRSASLERAGHLLETRYDSLDAELAAETYVLMEENLASFLYGDSSRVPPKSKQLEGAFESLSKGKTPEEAAQVENIPMNSGDHNPESYWDEAQNAHQWYSGVGGAEALLGE